MYVKQGFSRWKVSFWNGNDIKSYYVQASTKDGAIFNACELTNLRLLAYEPRICN